MIAPRVTRLAAFALALTLLPALALAEIAGTATVIDGDSLEVRGEQIRLFGIDAPEWDQLCRRDGKPWRCGTDATRALAGWLCQVKRIHYKIWVNR